MMAKIGRVCLRQFISAQTDRKNVCGESDHSIMTMINTLILFGSLHGFLLSIALTGKGIKLKNQSNILFGSVLFFLSFYLLEHYAVRAGILSSHPSLALITYPSLFFIGPLIFLYVRAVLTNPVKLSSTVLLLPGGLMYLMFTPFYLANANTRPQSCPSEILAGFGYLTPAIHPLFFLLFTVVFLVISARQLSTKAGKAIASSIGLIPLRVSWLKKFIYTLLLLFALGILYRLIVIWYDESTFSAAPDIQFLALSAIIHLVGYLTIMEPATFSDVKPYHTGEKYSTSSINRQMAVSLLAEIKSYVESRKLYMDKGLTIQTLSDDLKVSRHKISQVVNQELGMTFPDFINKYRIDAATNFLSKRPDHKMSALALDVGFANKVSFYRAFKKFTGTTPVSYLEKAQTG